MEDLPIAERVERWMSEMQDSSNRAFQPMMQRFDRNVQASIAADAARDAEYQRRMKAMAENSAAVREDFNRRLQSFRWPWTPRGPQMTAEGP